MRDAQRTRGIALSVGVDHDDLQPTQSTRRSKIDDRSGLANPALLIGNGDHASGRRHTKLCPLQEGAILEVLGDLIRKRSLTGHRS